MDDIESMIKEGRDFLEQIDARKIVIKIMVGTNADAEHGLEVDTAKYAALIGQYAYRYSEDIRKERDYWRKLAMDFHDAVHAEVEKRKDCQI